MALKIQDLLSRSHGIFQLIFFLSVDFFSSKNTPKLEFTLYNLLQTVIWGHSKLELLERFYEDFISSFEYVKMYCRESRKMRSMRASKTVSVLSPSQLSKVPRLQPHRGQGLAAEFPHCHPSGDLTGAQWR